MLHSRLPWTSRLRLAYISADTCTSLVNLTAAFTVLYLCMCQLHLRSVAGASMHAGIVLCMFCHVVICTIPLFKPVCKTDVYSLFIEPCC